MTELLQRVITELEKLPEDEQDVIATRLLAELEDERAWKVRFESTTNEQWDRLAQMVRQEIVASDTTPLDEVFSTQAMKSSVTKAFRKQLNQLPESVQE